MEHATPGKGGKGAAESGPQKWAAIDVWPSHPPGKEDRTKGEDGGVRSRLETEMWCATTGRTPPAAGGGGT